jgi:hypothetical protein
MFLQAERAGYGSARDGRAMWGRKAKTEAAAKADALTPLQDAIHQARVEAAERTSVVVDLRDAEVARLELLNEALDPLFAEIPREVELFDRGVSRGETPRLWIDAVAHIAMGRDKRSYRFLHDSRFGRHVFAESHNIPDIVQAVTTYVARRLVERQRALDEDPTLITRIAPKEADRYRSRWRALLWLAFGFFGGVAALVILALAFASQG